MSFRLYKEGEGIWARGALACLFGGTGLFAAVRLYRFLEGNGYFLESAVTVPLIGWEIGTRHILALLVMIPFVFVGIWLYNRKKTADFLIETEGELKNNVTWPRRKETVNNSIVVVVTCVILGVWIALADLVLQQASVMIYGIERNQSQQEAPK